MTPTTEAGKALDDAMGFSATPDIVAIEREAREGYVPASLSPEWHAELSMSFDEGREAGAQQEHERLRALVLDGDRQWSEDALWFLTDLFSDRSPSHAWSASATPNSSSGAAIGSVSQILDSLRRGVVRLLLSGAVPAGKEHQRRMAIRRMRRYTGQAACPFCGHVVGGGTKSGMWSNLNSHQLTHGGAPYLSQAPEQRCRCRKCREAQAAYAGEVS